MLDLRTLKFAFAGSALTLLAACATTRIDLTSSADRLERNAHAMAQDVREDADSPSGFSRDARALAEDARDFRHVVEDHGAGDTDVKRAFERVSRSYHAVRDDADRSDSRTAREDLRPVTDAYLDLEKAMGGYPERDRDYHLSER
jgi:hypothetical protein